MLLWYELVLLKLWVSWLTLLVIGVQDRVGVYTDTGQIRSLLKYRRGLAVANDNCRSIEALRVKYVLTNELSGVVSALLERLQV